VNATVLATVAAMAAATAATRLAGLVVPARWTEEGRLGAAFRALPVAVLSAIIAPTVIATGWIETAAAVVTILTALRLPLVATVIIGVVAAAGLRALF
jgi:uncharacterized membrane protein